MSLSSRILSLKSHSTEPVFNPMNCRSGNNGSHSVKFTVEFQGERWLVERSKSVAFMTWADVDAELDKIEAGDISAIVDVFWRYVGTPIRRPDGRRSHVNLTNFSAHVDIPRHRFQSMVDELRMPA